jgi:transcriptional regulator with XRE-family HTH domain
MSGPKHPTDGRSRPRATIPPGSLKAARLAAGLRQYDVDRLAGLPYGRVSRYERGERRPTPEVMEKLATVLHVPKLALFGPLAAKVEGCDEPAR